MFVNGILGILVPHSLEIQFQLTCCMKIQTSMTICGGSMLRRAPSWLMPSAKDHMKTLLLMPDGCMTICRSSRYINVPSILGTSSKGSMRLSTGCMSKIPCTFFCAVFGRFSLCSFTCILIGAGIVASSPTIFLEWPMNSVECNKRLIVYGKRWH